MLQLKKWQPVRKRSLPPDRRRSAMMLTLVLVGGLVLFLQMRWLDSNAHLFAPFAIERIPCLKCGKTGRVAVENKTNVLEMCPLCYGVGYHTVRRFGEQDVLCAACEGMGRLEGQDGQWRTCRRCDGRGLIRSNASEVPLDP